MADDVVLRFSAQDADKVRQQIQSIQAAAESLNKSLSQYNRSGFGGGESGGAGGIQSHIDAIKDLLAQYRAAAAGSTTLEGLAGTLGRAVGALATPFGAAAAGAGALAGAWAVVSHRSAEAAVQVYESGRAISRVSELSIADAENISSTFKLAGSNADSLSLAMFRMGNEIDEGGKHLRRFGIDIRNTDGSLKSAGDVFLEFRDKMSVASTLERNSAAIDIFGRQARQVIPLLQLSRERFAALREQAEQNAKWSDDLTGKTQEYRTALESLSQKWEGFWLGIAARSLPVITSWIERAGKLVDLMKAAANAVGLGQGGTAEEQTETRIQERARRYRLGLTREGARPESEIVLDTFQTKMREYERAAEEFEKAGKSFFTKRGTLTSLEGDDEALRRARSEIALEEQRKGERGGPERPSVNEESRRVLELQIRGKYEFIDKAIQADIQYYSQRARLAGESEGDIARMEESGLRARLEAETRMVAELKKRREALEIGDPGRAGLEREELERQQKVLGLQSALKAVRLRQIQGDVDAQRKALDETVADQKAASDQILTFIEAQKKARLDVIDVRGDTGMAAARERQAIEEDAATQTGMLQRQQITAQIEAKQQQLAAARATGGQLLEMERSLVGEINTLAGQRYNIEVETNRKILDSRKKLFEETKRLRLEEAEAGGSARSIARGFLGQEEADEAERKKKEEDQRKLAEVPERRRGAGGRLGPPPPLTPEQREARRIAALPTFLRPQPPGEAESKGPLNDAAVEAILNQMEQIARQASGSGAPSARDEEILRQIGGLREGFIRRGGGSYGGILSQFTRRFADALSGNRGFLLGYPGEEPQDVGAEPPSPPGIEARGPRPASQAVGQMNDEIARLTKESTGATSALKGASDFMAAFTKRVMDLMSSMSVRTTTPPTGILDSQFEGGQGTVPDTPLPKYHDGGEVKETGPALLEKGEFVLPRGDQESRSDTLRGAVAPAGEQWSPIRSMAEFYRWRPTEQGEIGPLPDVKIEDRIAAGGGHRAWIEGAMDRQRALLDARDAWTKRADEARSLVTMGGAGPWGGGRTTDETVADVETKEQAAGLMPWRQRQRRASWMQNDLDSQVNVRMGRFMPGGLQGAPSWFSGADAGPNNFGDAARVYAEGLPEVKSALSGLLGALTPQQQARQSGSSSKPNRLDPHSEFARDILAFIRDTLNRQRVAAVGVGR